MFTIEMDHDETEIILIDDHGHHEDVQFILYDDIVYIRQWRDEFQEFETIILSPDMFDEFRKSLDLPEGSYILRK